MNHKNRLGDEISYIDRNRRLKNIDVMNCKIE